MRKPPSTRELHSMKHDHGRRIRATPYWGLYVFAFQNEIYPRALGIIMRNFCYDFRRRPFLYVLA